MHHAYVILVRFSMFCCLYNFINEIQGKAFVIHLSFGDRNRFYVDSFLIVNMRQIFICLGLRGHRVI